jgi:hypothetical protein
MMRSMPSCASKDCCDALKYPSWIFLNKKAREQLTGLFLNLQDQQSVFANQSVGDGHHIHAACFPIEHHTAVDEGE